MQFDNNHLAWTQSSNYRIVEIAKSGKDKGKKKDKGWECDLLPKELIIEKYFSNEKREIDALTYKLENIISQVKELEEQNKAEDGAFEDFDTLNKVEISKRLREIKDDSDYIEEKKVFTFWLLLNQQKTTLNRSIKESQKLLDKLTFEKYSELNDAEIKTMVVDKKWLSKIEQSILFELDLISENLYARIEELSERYELPMFEMKNIVADNAKKVEAHLEKMGFKW